MKLVSLIDSQGNLYDCMITERRCIEYDWVETNDGTSGGGPGSPSDDPLPCDPTGTEPCYDDGGGGSIQPPEPDPCDEDNPPAWCECENEPAGHHVLDNDAVSMVYEDLWNKQLSSEEEQGGFLYMNALGNWQFFELTGDWVIDRGKTFIKFAIPSNLPSGSIYIHTHPPESSLTSGGITRKYKHGPSEDDEDAIELMKNTASVDYMVIIDPKYRILVNQNGDVIAEADRCGY